LHVPVTANEQDLPELNSRAGFGRQKIDVQGLIRADAVLPAARANDGVDGNPPW
jgi:hypothetical protein